MLVRGAPAGTDEQAMVQLIEQNIDDQRRIKAELLCGCSGFSGEGAVLPRPALSNGGAPINWVTRAITIPLAAPCAAQGGRRRCGLALRIEGCWLA